MSWVSLVISRAGEWLDTVFHNHRVIVSLPIMVSVRLKKTLNVSLLSQNDSVKIPKN